MQTTQGNMLLSLENVKTFTRDNADALGGVVTTGVLTMLGDSITELSDHASVQNGETRAAKGAIARRHALRAALLRDHMTPIARIARLELAGTPELVSLSYPKGKPTVERLAALANGMAHAAEPYADVFIHAGMKPDFIQALRTAADDMVQALKDRTQSKGKVRTATSALRSKLIRARKVVHVLDAMVKSALVGNQDLLAGWNLVKRVPQTRSSTAPAATTTTPAPSDAAAA
ncbi:MAG: hypothetical protein V4550_08950 [Gemmatimonadota bacterium]